MNGISNSPGSALLTQRNAGATVCSGVRRALVDRIGALDESLETAEDYRNDGSNHTASDGV
jgi:hypothetical protein